MFPRVFGDDFGESPSLVINMVDNSVKILAKQHLKSYSGEKPNKCDFKKKLAGEMHSHTNSVTMHLSG